MIKIEVLAPAKVNLALDILGITENGYHQVDMLMQTVSLYERLEIAKSGGFSLRCPGSRIPADNKNTAYKAAEVFFQETGLLAGADITVHKRVPTRAGLAGGSADAAAVLVGLNELYGARLTLSQLCFMGQQVGADVPFSITGGTARAEGIGEWLTPLAPLPSCWVVIAMPAGGGNATPVAYTRYDQLGSPLHPDMAAAVAAVNAGDLYTLATHMQNALEYANGNAETRRLRQRLDKAGALASMMTGSGAAVFGLFLDKAKAEAAANSLRGHCARAFLTQPVADGPRIVKRI